MKITSNIENSNYTQWITGFVESVINQADLKCNEVVIDEVDNDRIWLTIDGTEYIIRTWNFEPVTYDLQGRTCGERVDYTLLLSRKLNDALSSRLFYAHFDSHRDISHFKSSCFCELFF